MATTHRPALAGKIPTPTVGEILQEEFLQPLGMTPYRLAKELRLIGRVIESRTSVEHHEQHRDGN